jgi:hypothetical protein
MHPAARYCSGGCAASPSGVARPCVQCSIGVRSAVAKRFQLFGKCSRRRGRAAMPSKYESTCAWLPSLTLQVSGWRLWNVTTTLSCSPPRSG